MDIWLGLLIIVILHLVLYFVTSIFKSCAHYPYYQFCKGTGLEIKFLQIRWTTSALNRSLIRWGNGMSKIHNLWYTAGMYVTLVLLPISITLLLAAVIQDFIPHKDLQRSSILEPIIPGVNLPASEIGYYSLSIVVSSLVHELGHALAAVKEDVHIINFGFNVLFILPVAYVNLSSEKLVALNPWRQLRILCAGIWHNLVMAVIVYLIYLSLPVMLTAFFHTNKGIFIRAVANDSPLVGPRGIFEHDIITSINDCPVQSEDDWFNCLHRMKSHRLGLCATTESVHEYDESDFLRHLPNGGYACCAENKIGYLCFEYLHKDDGVLEIPPYVCLPARNMIEMSTQYCTNSNQCLNSMHCIRPYTDNITSVLVLTKSNSDQKVVYVGHPNDLLFTLEISPFIPKLFFSTTQFPDFLTKFMSYLCIFNIGLAVVNVLPCMFMDGQYITNTVVYLLLKNRLDNTQTITTLSVIASLLGMTLLICHCIYILLVKLVF